MKTPRVTVAIPTYNRGKYLGEALESTLQQDYENFEIIVIDNFSTDNTPEVVSKFHDSRIKYIRNEKNLGMIGNWNRAIELCKTEFLIILGDDDKLLPSFLTKSVSVFNEFPQIGFTFSHCNKVDPSGRFIRLWGYNYPPSGYLKGIDYLKLTIKHLCCLTNSSTVLLRKAIFDTVGVFKAQYGQNTFDFNMWLRIAQNFDTFFIDEPLADYRLHTDQVSELHWRTQEHPTGPLGALLEIMDLIASLFKSKYSSDPNFRDFLSESLIKIDERMTILLKHVISDI